MEFGALVGSLEVLQSGKLTSTFSLTVRQYGKINTRQGLILCTRVGNTKQCFVASKCAFYCARQRFEDGFQYIAQNWQTKRISELNRIGPNTRLGDSVLCITYGRSEEGEATLSARPFCRATLTPEELPSGCS